MTIKKIEPIKPHWVQSLMSDSGQIYIEPETIHKFIIWNKINELVEAFNKLRVKE
jgi:hypothetical protein